MLDRLAEQIRNAPGLQSKRDLAILSRLPGPRDGDDAAVIERKGEFLLLCGEAIAPALVLSDPHAAGAAAVVTNVADIRAMGGRPLGLIDMLVSPDRGHAEAVLDGIAWAAGLLGVDVAGGHLTIGHPAALSASCTGVARRPLRAANARPGDRILAAFSLEGRARGGENAYIFTSLRDRDPGRLRDDGEALVEVAEQGLCTAARDISMPGAAGSLLQFIEAAGTGAVLDVERLPRPPGIELARWLLTFPSFGFLLTAPPELAARATEPFITRGLACADCGVMDGTRTLRIAAGGETALVWDLAREPLTTAAGG